MLLWNRPCRRTGPRFRRSGQRGAVLAGRSAEAAREIKALIAPRWSGWNPARAWQTRAPPWKKSGFGQRVGDIIGEITRLERTIRCIGQVNTAVNQLDQMTQQNRAGEESAAAAKPARTGHPPGRAVQVFKLSPATALVARK